ncbi:MAG: cobalamin B12-binding domain-containing protein [Nitrospinae bacterium]|nr:cobalamin B12-binding domain-containing protein [Nitrospinota bacterium]
MKIVNDKMTQNDSIYIQSLKAAFDEFDSAKAMALAEQYVHTESEPYRFLTHIMKEAVNLVEGNWQGRLVSLTEVYRLGKAIESSGNCVLEFMKEAFYDDLDFNNERVRILITTFNDWHEFGKIIISTFLKFEGYAVEDIGMTPSICALVDAVVEKKPDILAISVLMVNSALMLANLRKRLDENGCGNVKVIAGGAPFYFDPTLAARFKFDGYASTPFEALNLVKKIMERK